MSRRQLQRSARSTLGVDDAGCNILHVDMDAFYASVELRRRPELIGKPVIVGHNGSRGVVLSATYEARALGIHSAMPMGRAKRVAPQAIIIEPDHHQYAEASAAVMAIFHSLTPLVEPLSLDEAFLDVAGAQRRLGSPAQIGAALRAQVYDEQRLPCSVGVAASKFVAKLASTNAKPDGLLVVPADQVIEFLHPLPVGALWGVGERTEEQLQNLGLRTVADVAHTPLATLQRALGNAAGEHLFELSWGRDPRTVTPNEPERSIGNEETFATDIDDPEIIRAELLRLSEKVAARCRRAEVVGRTVTIKVRFADFTTITRARTLNQHTDVGREIYATAVSLFDALHLQRARLRLVGVRLTGLADVATRSEQLMIGAPEQGWREAEQAVDRATARFGPDAVRPARLIASADDQ
jgi:DNA polymerase IV